MVERKKTSSRPNVRSQSWNFFPIFGNGPKVSSNLNFAGQRCFLVIILVFLDWFHTCRYRGDEIVRSSQTYRNEAGLMTVNEPFQKFVPSGHGSEFALSVQ